MSIQSEQPDYRQRIAEKLEEIEDDLEAIAATDTAAGERAQSSLDWLADYREGDDDE